MLDQEPSPGTDGAFHNTGVAARRHDLALLLSRAEAALESHPEQGVQAPELQELGRFLVTGESTDVGSFRTAPLRNVGVTAPYMHDGALETLQDVVDHYAGGGSPHPFLDARLRPLRLQPRDAEDLVAFLLTLTDERFARQQATVIERQRQLAAGAHRNQDDTRPAAEVAFAPRL